MDLTNQNNPENTKTSAPSDSGKNRPMKIDATISKVALKFLRDAYERTLEEWFDDPDEQFTGWTHAEFLKWFEEMVQIGKEIRKPLWTVAKKYATDYEIDRVKKMLREAGYKGK